ncbi:MAG: hypothetical protein ACFN24_02695 [Candidatus Nanogingivalis sp.]
MKKYKLLKDLPFAEEGAIFREWTGERRGKEEKALVNTNNLTTTLWVEDIENFDEWFEEVGEPEWVYYINAFGGVVDDVRVANLPGVRVRLKSTGNYFKTQEEAEKYLEYLKAKEVIKQDAKGFKPDWNNGDEAKFFGYWDFILEEPGCGLDYRAKTPNVYFQSSKDIKESFEKHHEEWKTYLTYEQ